MQLLSTVHENLLSPLILFFFLGVLASIVRSDLEFPRDVARGLLLYLLIAIGFEGGVNLARSGITPKVLSAGTVGAGFGLLFPVIAFIILRNITDATNAAAIAAQYGSISAVTFVTATAFLSGMGVPYEPFMVALMAVMESPAIASGIFLARRYGRLPQPHVAATSAHSWRFSSEVAGKGFWPGLGLNQALVREVFLNSSIVLLTGSLLIGFATGDRGLSIVKPVLVDPFKGVLTFFLLEMGLVAGRGLGEFRRLGVPLSLFGVLMPVFGGLAGAIAGALLDLTLGGTTLLAVLSGSASYIAVPAAMRMALPEANPSLYLTMSLGITFPFNVIVGIPLYYHLSRFLTDLF
ncbi:sodium-dependent bicarbonate transport family permease [Limnochorda pilosa]|uniref:Permease n=1 Tax=Limnochorda pilosa TaxID=1555112 RepID=A0A0K2SIQ0_LIMPI|nr:sodium-dependent bicarbonate transport family permease [Limnochorda pilosa]BAS26902.1 permease [Limnochorda pilosa]